MKILHIQHTLPLSANAAFRLHSKMLENGIESKMLNLSSRLIDENVSVLQSSKYLIKLKLAIQICIDRFFKLFKRVDNYPFSYPTILGHNVSQHPFVLAADIIYLHWIVGGFLNFKNLKQIFKTGKPVVIYMHDMWAITGGCHYSFDCIKYRSSCEYCEMFKGGWRYVLASKEFKKKKKLYAKYSNIYFISPSKWMDNCVSLSSLTKDKPHRIISNIVDENIFKSIDKSAARNILNIEQEKIVITFGCVSLKNKIKGLDYLLQALSLLEASLPIQVIIFGSMYEATIVEKSKFPVRFMGSITSDYLMALLNSASDIYITPSLAESFGLTILENLLCKTPVLAFNNTAMPEFIRHKENGYLARDKDSVDLANGINYLIENHNLLNIDVDYSSNRIIEEHLKVLNDILGTKKICANTPEIK